MCQQDFDFRLLSVGKMERRCDSDSTSPPRNSIPTSSDNGDDGGTYPSHCTSCSTTTTLTLANSLEDGSQGSEISGLDHQLPSMEKLKRSGCSNGTRRNTAGCLSCSRQRRDDYGGNDFGECHRHQHQLPPVRNTNSSTRSQQNEEKIMWRKERASLYTQFDSCASEIDTSTSRSGSSGTRPNCLLQSTSTTSSSSSSTSMRNTGTGCAVDEKRFRQQTLYCGLSRAIWIRLGTLILLSLHLQGVSAVRINSLSVPHIVRNGTEESVILDCDYSIEDHEKKGLVVKWYFSNQASPVYQWIPNTKPISLGILKGKLNLDYQADVDNYKMKRALQIIRPTTELSGNWMCQVSTFEGEAMKASRMIVFAPEKEMEMKVVENRRGGFVNVSCWATRVFPKPEMTFFYEAEQQVPGVTIRYEEYDGAYDVTAYKVIEDTTLSSMIGTVFECELAIPYTNYVRRRSTVFEPGSLELKDAMRMSIGQPRVSLDMTRLLLPITIFTMAYFSLH